MRRAPESFGQYLVHEELGVGGMASVNRAELLQVEGSRRVVALKRMLPYLSDNEEAVEAFVREARLAALMRHRNVAKTYDRGQVGDIYYIAMELITGRSLSEIATKATASSTPIPLEITLNLVTQLCDALDYAHNLCDESGEPLGLIHRDVSPTNVIITDEGVVKLIDFGVAKGSAAAMQTRGITIKGKFGYMAPEYLAGKLDARADVFAVGVIAYELLTNLPLFSADTDIETMNRLRSMQIAPPSLFNPQTPPHIDDIVLTALQRDPEQRWQSASALRGALAPTAGAATARVAEWIAQTFGETLAFDSSPALPIVTLEQPVEDPPDPKQEVAPPEVSFKVSPPEVGPQEVSPPAEAPPEWTDSTNAETILVSSRHANITGSMPVILREPEPRPIEPTVSAPKPTLVATGVVAPERTRQIFILLLLGAVIVAAVGLLVLRLV